jgi:FkbM family methyltransferase
MNSLVNRVIKRWREDSLLAVLQGAFVRLRYRALSALARRRFNGLIHTRGVELNLQDAPVGPRMRKELYFDEYEADESETIDEYITPDMDVVDLGACIGFTSCYATKRLAETSTLVAVEPNPEVHPAIKATRNRNNCEFHLVPAAYSATKDEIDIVPTETAWSASSYRTGDETVTVGTTSLDALIESFDLGDVAIIADIEGGEAELIIEELNILESHCKLLIIEFHGDKPDIDAEQREAIRAAKRRLKASQFDLVDRKGDVSVFVQF